MWFIKKEKKLSKITEEIYNRKQELKLLKDLLHFKEQNSLNVEDIISSYLSFIVSSNNLLDDKLDSLMQKEMNINKKKIKELKEVIKHKLNLKLDQKFSCLKFGNDLDKVNITDREINKNNKEKRKNILKYKNCNRYVLTQKKASNNASNISILKKKDKIDKIFVNKSFRINLNNSIKRKFFLNSSEKLRKKKNIFKIRQAKQKAIQNQNILSLNKETNNEDNKLLNKSVSLEMKSVNSFSLKQKNKINGNNSGKKEILYIKFNKNNIFLTENKKENLNKKYELFNNSIDGIEDVKKKLLIFADNFNNIKGYNKQNDTTLSSQPKKLIDKIRALKTLNKLLNVT